MRILKFNPAFLFTALAVLFGFIISGLGKNPGSETAIRKTEVPFESLATEPPVLLNPPENAPAETLVPKRDFSIPAHASAPAPERADKWDFDHAPFHPTQIEHWVGTPEKPNPGVALVKFYDGKEGMVFTKEGTKDGHDSEKASEKEGKTFITLNLMNQAALAKIQDDRTQLSGAAHSTGAQALPAEKNLPSSSQTESSPPSHRDPREDPRKDPLTSSDSSSSLPSSSSNAISSLPANLPTVSPKVPPTPRRLNEHDFEIVSFRPGLNNDRKARISAPSDLEFAILGPDADFRDIPKENLADEASSVKARLISLGHGGELILRVKNRGWIQDEAGPDFTIYENVFKRSKDVYYQEFARVGVAEENRPDAYRWFPCEPTSNRYVGCAGVIPTAKGGDAFDLSWLGVAKIKYIKIVDLGNNAHQGKVNGYGFESTEGFDFDSMILHHAYAL